MATEKTPTAPETTTAPAAPSTDITGLETVDTPPPINVTGTVAEMLSMRKADKPKTVPEKDEDKAKEKDLDDIDQKLNEMLFKKKKTPAKPDPETPAKEPEKDPETPAAVEPIETPAPAKQPAKAPAKKAVVKDRAAELRERELELEKQRLELERERLELEKKKSAPVQQKPQEEDLSLLSSDERYELEVFNVMSKLDPSKYGDLPKRFSDVAKATAKYKIQWEKDNPGEVFDADDSAHDAFFTKNHVKYDRKDFKRAELKLATEGETDPKVEKLEQANRQLLAKQKLQELEPQIVNAWANSLDSMIESINPDIVKVAREGGKAKLLEDYPVEGEEILMAAEALNVISIEAHRLLEGDGLFEPDNNNRVHARILDIIRDQERRIPSQAREDRLDPDGRDFATWSQWARMSVQEQANYWHIGASEVVDIVSRDLAASVRKQISRLEKLAESKTKRIKPEVKSSEIREKPAEHKSPSASPGGASKTTVDVSVKQQSAPEDNLTKIIRNGLFKRSP